MIRYRLCQLCRIDDDTDELVKYSTRHYAHAACILEELREPRTPSQIRWTLGRVCTIPTFPLRQVRDAAVHDHETNPDVVVTIDLQLRHRRKVRP